MRRLLLLALLILVSLDSRAATRERPVSDARIGFASASSPGSLIGTFNGERFLIAWVSMDRGGQAMVLDAEGEPVNLATGLPFTPIGVFWNGEVWIAVGTDGWVRIDRDGALLDAEARAFERPGTILAMTWTGSRLVVAVSFFQPTFPRVLKIAVYDAQMRLTATHDIDTEASDVRLASDGDSALLLYQRQPPVVHLTNYSVILDREGTPLRSGTLAERALAIGVAGNGGGYRLLKYRLASSSALFTSFHLDRGLIRTDSHDTYGVPQPFFGLSRTLSWDGSSFTFFYQRGALNGVRVSENGVALADERVLTYNDYNYDMSYRGVIAIGGAGTTLFFYTTTSEPYGKGQAYLMMRAGRSLGALADAEEKHVELGGFQQTVPVAASSASQSLVAWRERLASPAHSPWVLATRVSANGEVRDPLSLTLGEESCSTPSVASDGEGFLVAWYDGDGLIAAQVGADGKVGARTRVQRYRDTVCRSEAPKVLSNGSDYLVVWTREHLYRDDVFAARVSRTGALIDTVPVALGTTTGRIDGASDGDGYLLAWDGRYLRMGANGVRLDPRIEANNGDMAAGDATVTVWWNGTTYSLLQRGPAPGPFLANQYQFVRVAPNGTVTKVGDWFSSGLASRIQASGGGTCDGTSCTFVDGLFESGTSQLRELRVTDDGVSPSIAWGPTATLAAIARTPPLGKPQPAAAFRVAGGRLLAAFTRFAYAPPSAGISRVFLASMDDGRGRVVRH